MPLDSQEIHVMYMNCPRCELTVQARAHYLIVDRCPRCLARRRQLVQMEPVEVTSEQPPHAFDARTRGDDAPVLRLRAGTERSRGAT
jgi:hypothetical protein